MPIHPHHCPDCGEFEVITFSVHQEVNPTCPGCGKKAERRFGVPRLVKESTDSTFFAGAKLGGSEFGNDPDVIAAYTGPAKAAGVSIQGKQYCPTLARFPGDPQAFISDRTDIGRICRERGLGNKKLGIKPKPGSPPPEVAIDETLVDDRLDELVARGMIDSREKEKKRGEVREKMTPRHRRKFIKEPPPKTVKRPPPGKKKV